MSLILIPVMALAVSMMVIPLMLRVAPALGLVDRPSARKVHAVPMARVGGWGIVLGALVPLLIALDLGDPLVQTYLFGALVLLASGTWDDSREVGHYAKFVGQTIAVLPLVTYGGLRVERLPFMGFETLPLEVSIPFTAFALVGVINALNHSDGLDGLAGGEALLSLLAMMLLAYLAEGVRSVPIALAVIGSTLGFLRYNTYPARLFMGDSGSQFLGFTVGVVVVLLTQHLNPALSAAIPALLLGLPVLDIVTVLAQRIYQGMNWFKATKNHIHHRLLDLGFEHHEAVVLIYSVQALFIVTGVALRYAMDGLVLGVYLVYCVALFAVLLGAKRVGWRADQRPERSGLGRLVTHIRASRYCQAVPLWVLGVGLSVYLVGEGLASREVPRDFGLMSAVLLAVLAVELVFRRSVNPITVRGIVYTTAVFVVYLSAHYAPSPLGEWSPLEIGFFAVVAVALALALRCGDERAFKTTPMDYLMVLVLVALGVLPHDLFGTAAIPEIATKGIILLYASEIFLHEVTQRWNVLTLGAAVALGTMVMRGLP